MAHRASSIEDVRSQGSYADEVKRDVAVFTPEYVAHARGHPDPGPHRDNDTRSAEYDTLIWPR